MAEAIGTEIVKSLVVKAGSRLYKEVELATDIDSHIKKLVNTKSVVEASLLDANSTHPCSHAQRDVLEKLSDGLDEVLDFIDARAAKAKQKELMGGNKLMTEFRSFFSPSNQLVSTFRDARKAKAIIERLNCIAENHAYFGGIVSTLPVIHTHLLNLDRGSYTLSAEVIGRDKDKDNILNILFDPAEKEILSVVSIVGIGGMGKTTLAQYVYHDERVRNYFDLRLWVFGTQIFNVREILEKILASVSGEAKHVNLEMDQLQRLIQREIVGRKLLLVLDNIWDQDSLRSDWLELRKLLVLGAPGSKVFITTRSERVARKLSAIEPYMLTDLAAEDAWLLFQRVASTVWQEPGVLEIGKDIAKMCRNVPLVIQSIGSLMAGKTTVAEWRAFRDDQLANLTSYGRDIVQTLKLSYDQLDPKLKLCFVYCSLFPKQFEFDTNQMIDLWVALGYVEPLYINQSLEEAGVEYVLKLLSQGFFQHMNMDDLGGFQHFRMHDLMHDLACSIAGSKYEVINSEKLELQERVRHVSFHSQKMTGSSGVNKLFSFTKTKQLQLQSLIWMTRLVPADNYGRLSMCPCISQSDDIHFSNKFVVKFPCLRVLDLHGLGIKELPRYLGGLISLRYLNVSNNPLSKLPDSLTELVNLNSLNLCSCLELQNFPRGMSRLQKLRHLYIVNCPSLTLPSEIGCLTDLQTLEHINVKRKASSGDGVSLADLNRLNNLRGALNIYFEGRSKDMVLEAVTANLSKKEKIVYLTMSFPELQHHTKCQDEMVLEALRPHSNLRSLIISGHEGMNLPRWITNQVHLSLPNLVELQLSGFGTRCVNLCSFGRLPYLKFLSLEEFNDVEFIEDGISDMTMDESRPPIILYPCLEKLKYMALPT